VLVCGVKTLDQNVEVFTEENVELVGQGHGMQRLQAQLQLQVQAYASTVSVRIERVFLNFFNRLSSFHFNSQGDMYPRDMQKYEPPHHLIQQGDN